MENKNKIDWKRKLSSRKFWAALIAFITPLLVAFNVDNLTIQQTVALITSGGGLIAYILSEGYVDGKYIENKPVDIKGDVKDGE